MTTHSTVTVTKILRVGGVTLVMVGCPKHESFRPYKEVNFILVSLANYKIKYVIKDHSIGIKHCVHFTDFRFSTSVTPFSFYTK
jgi:hypothetical protein